MDAAGNKDECSFTVTIKDNEKPTISCPGDITVTAPPGQYTAMVNYIPPAVTDNCGTPTLVRNQGFSPGGQFPLGSTAVTYTATDTASNSVTCSFTVMVEPGETEGGPAIFNNCPATITHSVSTYTCGANVAFQIPTASDDSGDLEVVRVSGPGPGDFF
ncbi:HYR domain-containing protein [Antarcticibacterium sp. 1MA-6-2]|uniref:HYR domain-containing protein n=1 Tax=Antarcticibacterium sp. 1MA-6-2 TaxID=2908210 RepID=UPI001F267596|nr:HYR domain-containing protein [Antarcticibacterium sp. 1MA-6-2]UJH91194.1 HYR domain-containing protein [Antarcticibacterium sp. 1MA-6-2]